MAKIGNDTPEDFREKLEKMHARKYPDAQIIDYKQVDYSYGLTAISFNEYLRRKTYFKLPHLLPATFAMDGLIRKFQEKRIKYFHTESGAYLGSSENEAVNRSKELGEKMMKSKQYGIARSFYNIAYNLCLSTRDSRSAIFAAKKEEAEREVKKLEKEREVREQEIEQQKREEEEAREQERREQQKREQEAAEQEARTEQKRQQEAREQETRELQKREQEAREEKEREEEIISEWEDVREAMKLESEKTVAKNSFKQGLELWSEAFALDISGERTHAKSTFETSVKLLTNAAMLEPANEQYSNWYKALQLKLEGDKKFNDGSNLQGDARKYTCFLDGYNLQEQGTQFFQKQNYEEALDMYEEARKKYKEGFELSGDSRFEACVKIVQEMATSVKKERSHGLLKNTLSKVELCPNTEQSGSSHQETKKSGNFFYSISK